MVVSSLTDHISWIPYSYMMVVVAIIMLVTALSLCTICYDSDKKIVDKGRKTGLSMCDYNARYNGYMPVDTMTGTSRGTSTSVSSDYQLSLSSNEEKLVQPSLDDLHIYGLFHTISPYIPEPPDHTCKDTDLGNLYFTLTYTGFDQILEVTIQRATNLPAKDLNGLSDPYVAVCLLPEKGQKLMTRVRKRKLNPVWNEVLCFEGYPFYKLQQRTLYLKVYDHDTLSRDDKIGEVKLPLSDVYLLPEPVPFVKKLQPCKQKHRCESHGSLLVSLCYLPTNNCMEVIVMKCDKLRLNAGNSGIYVKTALVLEGKKVDRKRTILQQKSCNPVWNETMEFEVPFSHKQEVSFVFKIVGEGNGLFRDALLGRVVVGSQSNGASLDHWNDALSNARKATAMWHSIV